MASCKICGCWQIHGADSKLCKDVCNEQDKGGCGECPIGKAFDRLAAYEDSGLEPCDYSAMQNALKKAERAQADLTEMIRIIGNVGLERLQELAQAENDGRLVVLPCGTDVELERDGHIFKADHWNHTLTAFRDAPENKSGKQIALFSIKEAEAALEGGEG